MSGATASLPSLQDATNASTNAQNGLGGFLNVAQSLASGSSDSPLNGVTSVLGRLDGVLHVNVSGLSQQLPQVLTTIENALPPDTLRFVEGLKDSYQQVSDFLSNSELVKQIHPGATLEATALALVDDVLAAFQTRLGSSLIDADLLDRVKTALALIEQLASGSPIAADQVVEFLAQNLLGVDSNLLTDANTHLGTALGVLDPFSDASLETRIGATRDALSMAYKDFGNAFGTFDEADLAAYTALGTLLDALGGALNASLAALQALYDVLTAAVSAPEWDTLFAGYTTVLNAIHLEDIPTVDDAVDALAGMVESLLARLTMSLSPDDLAAQVGRLASTIHDLFAHSPLGQVRQILNDFIGKIQAALEQIPSDQVEQAVHGVLDRIHQELDQLGIAQIRTTIQNGFQAAHDFIDNNINDGLLTQVKNTLDGALAQMQNIPFADLTQALTTAIQQAGQVVQNLETQLSSALNEVKSLLASLDSIDFKPVADSVIDEIDALKAKLAAIDPNSLSDIEKTAIQAALSVLRAIDLEGMIENELKKGFAELDDKVTQGVQTVLNAWLEFRRRIGNLDGSTLAAPVMGFLDQVGNVIQSLNGSLVIAPLKELVGGLLKKLDSLSPGAILDPLQAPYDSVMQTIQRANPDVWVEPLRALHTEIDRLINLIDITPLLDTLEQKESDLFAQARQAIASALDDVHLPAPLDTFYDQMKTLIVGLTDAVFGDPGTAIQQFSASLSVQPSTLFEPLDMAFDRLLAAIDAIPSDQMVAALEAIRQEIGAALPALDPANIIGAMRTTQGRVAALSPAALAGAVTLPGMRATLAAKLALTPDNPDAKAALLAKFDQAIAPLDLSNPASSMVATTQSHQALVTALRQRINALDASGAQQAYQRLYSGLRRVLPDFLMQAQPLDLATIQAGLATLRPSTKARRIDIAIDHFLAQLAPLETALSSGVNAFFDEIKQAALLIHPAALKDSVSAIYATLRQKLDVLDPDQIASELKTAIWDPLMDPLNAINPSAIKAQLQALYQDLVDKVSGVVNALLDDVAKAVDTFLASVRQALSQVLDTLKTQIKQILDGVDALVAQLDALVVDDLFHGLLNMLGNLKTSFDQELDRVKNDFDDMLNTIPLGGSSGAVGAAA